MRNEKENDANKNQPSVSPTHAGRDPYHFLYISIVYLLPLSFTVKIEQNINIFLVFFVIAVTDTSSSQHHDIIPENFNCLPITAHEIQLGDGWTDRQTESEVLVIGSCFTLWVRNL